MEQAEQRVPHLRAKGRVPELDGLRGIAVLAVMVYHFSIVKKVTTLGLDVSYYKLARMGWTGVDLFFVLSGFLITGILLEARESSRHYFRSFYARRVLRIFPLYYAYLAGFFLVLPLFANRVFGEEELAQLAELRHIQIWLWLYASNLWTFLQGEHTGFATSHFWSLAIEEQFYLVWPLVVFAVSRRTLQRICVAMLVAALAIRVGMHLAGYAGHSIYAFTPARMDTLLSGALLAIIVRTPVSRDALVRWARRTLVACGSVAFALLWFLGQDAVDHWSIYTIGYSLQYASFASMIVLAVEGADSSRWARLLRSRALIFLGTYSYGLYVLHVPVRAVLVRAVGKPVAIAGTQLIWELGFLLLGCTVTIALALASWHLMEKRFLKLKRYVPY